MVVFLLVAGVRLSGWWVPRAVLVSAAVFALGFAAMNPDAWVAGRNIDRFDAGQRSTPRYLSTLGADATPVIVDAAARPRWPPASRGASSGTRPRPTTGWRGTSGASRAATALATSAGRGSRWSTDRPLIGRGGAAA